MKPVLAAALTALAISTPMPAADYSAAVSELESIVRAEMSEWGIGGISLALVDGDETVHLAGFGEARADSIFRAGSISKLFNAIAVMQQAEAGALDIDAPIPADALPVNPWPDSPPVTLRRILTHRSGLQREATVGGYFDDSQPGLEATVRSLAGSALATRPGEKIRYSNVAPSLAGYLAVKAAGADWDDYQQQRIFGPLEMKDSSWSLAATDRDRIVVSHMRVADGMGGWSRRDAPVFDLGTIPAGNLFSTAGDLAKFASALLAGGRDLVKPETLREMWTPQFPESGDGFGIAFAVGSFRNHRRVGHNGAVYGHSTSLAILPDDGIAVVVLGNEDIANARIARISDAALSLMLEAKSGEKPPAQEPVTPPAQDFLKQCEGEFESQSYWARLTSDGGKLRGEISGQPVKFTFAGGGKFRAVGRIYNDTPVEFRRDADGAVAGFSMGDQNFVRVPKNPPAAPEEWAKFTGSYGPDFIPVVVSLRHGHLYAMTENMVDYRLTPVTRSVFSLPPGMYVDEHLVFLTGPDGGVHGMDFANMLFPRIP